MGTWDDYWWEQRYDDAMYDEHVKGHPNSDSTLCVDCQESQEQTNGTSS